MSLYWRLWEKPLGRVVFAGEHTDALYPGTLEGALRSGLRAATQVQDLKAGKAVAPVEPAAETKPEAVAKAAPTKEEQKGFFSRLFNGVRNRRRTSAPPAHSQRLPNFRTQLFKSLLQPAPASSYRR